MTRVMNSQSLWPELYEYQLEVLTSHPIYGMNPIETTSYN